ncbi:Phosphatidylinositol-4,5-bisphosphate 4-phosphatase [Aphelenchoides besseyi]|nr:Phosphatidylinositol-4,5-bisphosphate 4-phosphatase [Aphelenchoides besseyi]KAI6201139.1 Phosphatidylinositol-4,5-bisphosphate 4-phosphatase [Aphelenchoides besseyi]
MSQQTEQQSSSQRVPMVNEHPIDPHSSNVYAVQHNTGMDHFVDANEDRPLLNAIITDETDDNDALTDSNYRLNGTQTVTCRVCENQIPYENKTMQHVIRCPACNEATPIRAAPTGKKFVRCPCNCLLICKISSNRIACPRPNCSRVIILKPTSSGDSTIPAPAGTARVQCYYCEEVFMFNTIASHIARCPHCQKRSSVSVGYVRSRSFGFFLAAMITFLIGLVITIGTVKSFHAWVVIIYILLLLLMIFFVHRLVFYFRLAVSKILGPI